MTLSERRRGFPTYRNPSGTAPARPEAKQAESRGFRISYDDYGDGSPIVLLSGFMQSGADWWELGYPDRLRELGWRVLVVDPLGHGSSDRPHDPESYLWPDVAFDIVATMDVAGVDRAPIWGFSRGTWLATTVAVEAPDRVTALILGAGGDIGATPPTGRAPWIEALLDGDWAAFFATPAGSVYHAATQRYHERVNDPVAFGAALAGRRLRPYTIDLARITIPSLVYVGSEDQPEMDRRTAETFGVELHELPGVDHRTGLMAIDAVMELVAPFLAATR